MWSLAVLAYCVAVFHRASLGVTGLTAQHRYGAGAAVLSLFSVLQLAVYAAMQIPVGMLLDRFGSKRLLVVGGLVMAAGQYALAVAHTVPLAVLARVLVGAGDAMTFISVLRLLSIWFPSRQVPVMAQLTALIGQLGQVTAAYPLVALLRQVGWTRSFEVAATVGLAVTAAVALLLRDRPHGATIPEGQVSLDALRDSVRHAWREPGTRLGLWTHFTTQFSASAFALLWGYPFLVAGEGLRPGTAAALLSLLVLCGMVVGPVLGRLVAMFPHRRSVLPITAVTSSALAWTVVLAWPGRAPLWLLVVLILVLSTNGPGAMVGLDYARTENPEARLGSASGIVNIGGFLATLTTILLIGAVLDLLSTGGPASYTLQAFKVAMCVQYPLWVFGLWRLLHMRRVLRAQRAASGIVITPFSQAVLRRARARRRPHESG
ncbi:MAG: Transporter, superfamily [Frankiales bacterium]|nr:Transporter, superfamily [Frankiales bacterium]